MGAGERKKIAKKPVLYGLYKHLECELLAVVLIFIIPPGVLSILLLELGVDEDLRLFIVMPVFCLFMWRVQRWSEACEEWKEEERIAKLLEKS